MDINGGALEKVVGTCYDTVDRRRVADIADELHVDAYMSAGVDAFGRVDLYHLNAGIFGSFTALPDLEIGDFDGS